MILENFKFANDLKDKFCALGPRFLKTKKKGHIQIDKNLKIGKIDLNSWILYVY